MPPVALSMLNVFQKSQRAAMKSLFYGGSVMALAACLSGCTVLAIADAAGSALVYGVKTTVNVLDAVTPDVVNKKKD